MNKEQIAVAHVVLGLNVGGLERVVVNLVRGFRDTEYRMAVCCLESRGPFAAELEKMGVPVHLFDKKPGFDLGCIVRLADFLRSHEVKIIHTHNPAPHFHGLAAALLAGVPVRVHTRHGRNYPDNRKKVLLNHLLSWSTSMIVPVSNDAREVARDVEHIPARKLHRIWNGVDTDRYRPAPDTGRLPPIIGTVGRLSPEKDYGRLIEAFARVHSEMPEVRLAFIGNGPCAPDLRDRARSLGLGGQIEFLGERADIPEQMHRFAIFSLSSVTEGLSMTLLEAMASGLPIVATDVGGNREIVRPPECGLLAPPTDPRALADALVQVLRDPGQRARMGAAARARAVAHFSLASMVAEYRALYDELLGTATR